MKAIVSDQDAAENRATQQRWVDTWQGAGDEQIRRALQSWPDLLPRLTSGLVEQPAWFAKRPMTPLFEAALDLQNFFNARQRRFCIIGGICSALGRAAASGGCEARIPDAAAFARRNRVLLLNAANGSPDRHRSRRATF